MSTVRERLLKFIREINLTTAEFERQIGVSSGYVNNISKSIQPDKLEIISDKFPQLNINWLLLNKGEMKKSYIAINYPGCTNIGSSETLEYIEVPEQAKELMEQIIKAGLSKQKSETESNFGESDGISERILSLVYEIYNKDIKKAADESGVPYERLEGIIGGESPTNLDAYRISKLEQVNPDWLFTGKGEMLKSKTSTIPTPPNNNNITNYKLVPLLNLDAVGGIHSPNVVPGDREYADQLIPFTDAQEGDVALTVSGESMSPTCPPGSRVLIRQIPQWREYFGYGNIFVLLLTDGRRILKEVQKYPEDSKNYILCKSHNDKYPEEELPKSMIASVWKVIKILNERGW